jgi:kumamolisin
LFKDEVGMAIERKDVVGSERVAPDAPSVGAVDPNATTTISLYVKSKSAAPEPGAARIVGREAMKRERETNLAGAFARLSAFAAAHNLKVVERDAARRLMRVSGTIGDLGTAFGADMSLYQDGSEQFRGRTGMLTAPADVADDLEAVLGLDQRPIATPKSIRAPAAQVRQSFLPNAVAGLYGFPVTKGAGKGECVAIIELGGGVSDADTAAAFKAMGIPAPKVTAVLVSGGTNQPGKDPNADGEVALDVQVAGGAAPAATFAVYFAPNTDQGFVDAITYAVHDAANKPSVMSISWGSPESGWTQQAIAAMTSAFQDAAQAGVSVFAASGDGLATDGQTDGKPHVDFPASSPWVVGCGGTALETSGGARSGETVWNSNGGGTGGGVSDLFAVPAYQSGVKIPAEVGAPRASHKHPRASGGRGVPDVAADADPSTGYRVVVDGQNEVIGGTSAAAPLWAGLFALVNQAAGKPVGQPHPTLYANPGIFNDVTQGNNKSGTIGYSAGPGWDACTGLGTPKGAAVAKAFSS